MADNEPEQQSPRAQGPELLAGDQPGILPPEHWALANDGGDSTLGEDKADSTASLTSSILRYRTINGRTYHSERGNALYWGSNDERQSEALDINHHAQTLAIGGKLHLAPLEKDKIKTVLDVGTGTGIWAIDFGDAFPNVEVIGTDISPIQPTWVPPNVRFEMEDCTQPWTFTSNSFDYIHIRGLVGSIDDWAALFKQAYDCLKPGGWLESYEVSPLWESDDGTVPEESALGQWGRIFVEGGRKFGRTFTVVADELQRKEMESVGFVDIEELNIKQPIGRWPKDEGLRERGEFVRLTLEQDAEGLVLFIAGALGWKKEEVMVFLANFKREVRSGRHHAFYRQKVVWGRKPEE